MFIYERLKTLAFSDDSCWQVHTFPQPVHWLFSSAWLAGFSFLFFFLIASFDYLWTRLGTIKCFNVLNNHKAASATCYVLKINMPEPRTESRPVDPRYIGDNSEKLHHQTRHNPHIKAQCFSVFYVSPQTGSFYFYLCTDKLHIEPEGQGDLQAKSMICTNYTTSKISVNVPLPYIWQFSPTRWRW